MRNFKIFQIISSFGKDELKEFEIFVKSPYLARSRNYSPIIKTIYLYQNYPDGLKGITAEEFFAKIFPRKSYNNKTLRNRLNELTALAKKFLIQKTLEKDVSLCNLLLLKALKEKKLFSLFMSESDKAVINLNSNYEKSFNTAETILLSAYLYQESQDFGKMFLKYREYTDYMIIYFSEMYFNMMLEYQTEKQYNINTENNIAYDLMNNLKAEKFIRILEEKNNPDYLIIILIYYLYKSYADINDEASYKKFSDTFFKNIGKLSDTQKNGFFDTMISRFLDKVNSGKAEFLKEIFKLYNIKLKLGLYDELRTIRYPSLAYRDYIVVGLKLKKYKWVENFIKYYSDELPSEIRNDEINTAYARLFFFKKEYNTAIAMLNRVKTSNYIYVLDASRMKLRIYYEKSDFEEAFLEIDRAKHYIRNNTKKIALSVRNYSKEFLNNYLALLKVRLNPDKKEIDYLLNIISKSSNIAFKDWFIEKIKEMKMVLQ